MNSPPDPLSSRREGEKKNEDELRNNQDHVIIRRMKEEIILSARGLRKNQTPAENILWKQLRNRKFIGKKFLRQHPLVFEIEGKKRFFIADFFCNENKLIIEVDGGIHSRQKEYDQHRNLIINELGFQVIRVTNKTIQEDLNNFLIKRLTPLLFSREGAGG